MSEIDFRDAAEIERGERLLRDGYVIEAVESHPALDRLRELMVSVACGYLQVPLPSDPETWLNRVGDLVPVDRLNAFRIAVIAGMNAQPWVRRAYFDLARNALGCLVGNELAMQRRLNVSIQLPGDDSSLLPLHADTWSGDSPFEMVLWVPFTRCYGTKAMFILPPEPSARFTTDLHAFKTAGVEAAYDSVKSDLTWIEIDYGQFMLFNQNLPHGNRVNVETETRWSTNCRFKGLFTPYADKKLGEFFEPITLRPASRLGLDYAMPEGFDE